MIDSQWEPLAEVYLSQPPLANNQDEILYFCLCSRVFIK